MPHCLNPNNTQLASVRDISRVTAYEAKASCMGIASGKGGDSQEDNDRTRYFNVTLIHKQHSFKTFVRLLKVESVDIKGKLVHMSLNEVMSGYFRNGLLVKITYNPLINMTACVRTGVDRITGFTGVLLIKKILNPSDVQAFSKLLVSVLEYNFGRNNDPVQTSFESFYKQISSFGLIAWQCFGTQTLQFNPPLSYPRSIF